MDAARARYLSELSHLPSHLPRVTGGEVEQSTVATGIPTTVPGEIRGGNEVATGGRRGRGRGSGHYRQGGAVVGLSFPGLIAHTSSGSGRGPAFPRRGQRYPVSCVLVWTTFVYNENPQLGGISAQVKKMTFFR